MRFLMSAAPHHILWLRGWATVRRWIQIWVLHRYEAAFSGMKHSAQHALFPGAALKASKQEGGLLPGKIQN